MNHGGPEVQRYVSQIRIATMPFQRGERFPMIVALVADANQYDIPISSKINFLNYPKPDEGYVAIRYSRDSSRLLEPDSTVMSEHDYQSVRRLLTSAPWTERIWSLIQGRSLTVGDTIRIDSTEAQLLIREPDAKFRISSPLSLCLLGVRTDTLGNPLAELAISYTETLSIPLAESESLCSIQAFVETDTGRLKKMILWEEEEVYYTMINDRVRTFKMQSINVDWVELKQR
jgi:hypothetical protein